MKMRRLSCVRVCFDLDNSCPLVVTRGRGMRTKRTEGKPFENEAGGNYQQIMREGIKANEGQHQTGVWERQRPMDTETRHFKYCGRAPVEEKKGGVGEQDANQYLLATNTLLYLLQSV